MKKNLYTLILTLCVWGVLDAQVPKKILVEETTQASCPPCATLNPAFDAMIEANLDKVVPMKYQVWWPGFDPMYEENTVDVIGRVQGYLGPNAAPNMYVNGGNFEAVTALTQARIDQLYNNETSPISITIDHNLNDATGSVDIDITIKNESNNDLPANTYRLITVVQEDEILYASAPGTNGELDFKWVMRKMLPDANGTMLATGLAAGASETWNFSTDIPWYTKDLTYLAATAWVENPSTRQVIQAEHSAHKPLMGNYPDLATSYSLTNYDGLCDDMVDAEFQVRNAGSTDVTSFDINVINADGSLTVVESWAGTIAPGASETVVIPGLMLNAGANTLRATINNIDGRPDKNGHNSLVNNEVYYVLAQNPFTSEVNEGFDVMLNGEVPPNMIIQNPNGVRLFTVNQTISTAVNWPLGGHGNSDGCMRFDFATWPAALDASFVFEKVDLSNSENTTFEFTHAYAARGGLTNDRIEIEVSTDCGESWVNLYSETGANIVTGADPGAANRFYPRPNEWADVKIDISSVDGAAEAIFRFRGISGSSQAYYVDDVIIKSNPATAVDNIDEIASLKTYPNPASDVVNVEINLDQELSADISVYDLSGKKINTLSSGTLTEGTQIITWYPENSGIYMVKITSNEGVVSQKVTVVK